jgi:phosphatidylinositol glycan class K
VYGNRDRQIDLYGDSVEVDYGGYDVTVENFLRLLTGAYYDPRSCSA